MRTYAKIIIILIVVIISVISIPLTPSIPIVEKFQNEPPIDKLQGSFRLVIHPYEGLITPGERVRITGYHQYNGTRFE